MAENCARATNSYDVYFKRTLLTPDLLTPVMYLVSATVGHLVCTLKESQTTDMVLYIFCTIATVMCCTCNVKTTTDICCKCTHVYVVIVTIIVYAVQNSHIISVFVKYSRENVCIQ